MCEVAPFSTYKMFTARQIVQVRCYTSKWWVTYKSGPAIQVSLKGCENINEFAQKVRQKFQINDSVTLSSSLTNQSLDPSLALNDPILKDDFMKNSKQTPLFAGNCSKTIFIRDIDEYFCSLDTFCEVVMENDDDLKSIYACQGSALYLLNEPNTMVMRFRELIHGGKYDVYSRHGREEMRWLQMCSKYCKDEVPCEQPEFELKTIYIRDYEFQSNLEDTFSKYSVYNDVDLKEIYRIYDGTGIGLSHISEPKKLITKYWQLKNGEKYHIYSRYGSPLVEE